jgi:hypothetical protein
MVPTCLIEGWYEVLCAGVGPTFKVEHQRKEKHDIPPGPSINVPTRTHPPILRARTCDVAAMDDKYIADEMKFKQKKTHREHEAKGGGSMYSQLQPFS